ncbi:helix-turn-helix transcriptional regulator [Runella sp. SP2]|uniref:helix-turn-helix domain-containing protein n=1 Tax=Runella sp. SP2 TaxID=2268026 RepID=UPI000F078C33|nr:helix-turn-helix transcriptional regulator [Runella sp. SP2]AYQ31406.1 hypothetical protein DTQ70_04075 [Runella sp. SP2]
MENNIAERFKVLIKELGKSNHSFALSIAKNSTTISNIVDGKSKPGYELLETIFQVYPQVSRDWLLMGEGTIFRSSENVVRSGEYLQEYLQKLESNFERLNRQIEVKDQQIAQKDKQIDRLMDLLGKPECVTEETGLVIIEHPSTGKYFRVEALGTSA